LEELPVVSLFGQVWLWSLLSFVAGVLVTWLVQVRPAKQRLAELEANRLGGLAGPARPQPVAPPSQVSSPMRDDEFDDWHVGARANSDALLAPPPAPVEQMWPESTGQESPRSYEPPPPAQPYEPPRSAEPPRTLEPQRLVEPPRPLDTPLPVRAPEPRQSDDAVPYKPVSAFGKVVEPEPEPESDHDYDELPPALTRIPENAEPSRVAEPVEVPEEEKPRSLFQRLDPTDEVQAEPVPLNPAQEPTVFRRADLDELPDVAEIPADHARYQPAGAPAIAPPQEEPTAPPEVEEWHPREMWREEEEEEQAELEQAARTEHEDELLDDREEDFAADDSVPATVEAPKATPVHAEADDDAETDVEETSVIPAGEVQRAIDAADARRDADRQPWPEHSLTGQFPAVTDDIASNAGKLGVEPDDPDYRRDDPDEPTASASAQPTPAEQQQPAESRSSGYPATEFISVQSLTSGSLTGKAADPEPQAESTAAKPSEPNTTAAAPSADPRSTEPRTGEPAPEPGQTGSRPSESRPSESRTGESRSADTRGPESYQPEFRPTESRPADSHLPDSRQAESRPADSRQPDARQADFRQPESRQADSGQAESRQADARQAESRQSDSRQADSRQTEPRQSDSRQADSRQTEPGQADSRQAESRQPESRAAESRSTDPAAAEFFPAKPTPADQASAAKPAKPSKPAEVRTADFFAPQPIEPEPAAPAPAAKAKPAPAQPAAGERPRSLFEPIVGASDDDPEPAETVRQLPPTDDQPFVPTLAPSLLERGSNGLPQRPQRPAGGPPPMTSPPLLGPPQPVSKPTPLPPKRPRPVGFSPSTGGRSETPAPVAPRFQQSEGFNPRSPFGPGSVLPKSDGHAPAADFEVKATLTGRRYFRPGTSSFDNTRADVWFRTEADAQKAGFRPAQ
jgi:hypothetical protein